MIVQDLVIPLTAILVIFHTPPSVSGVYFRKKNHCVCGQSNELASRIVQGEETSAHKYPWAAVILRKGKFHCGGSLINDRFILSAGHCFFNTKVGDLSVVLGSHKSKEWPHLMLDSKDLDYFVVHEDFTSDAIHDINDIALIKLKKPVTFSKTVKPVCLPKPGRSYVGSNAVIAGWGRVGETSSPATALRETQVTVITNKECKKAPIVGAHIIPSMMCAYKEGTDACQGDSGGPLVFEGDSGRFDQIGVVSWGVGCARTGIPGIYTRITDYLEWISYHTTDAVYCSEP